jgi:nucleoside-diphosphate-sugar epimerase
MVSDRYLVTGAFGCIGAWVVRELVDQGAEVLALDVGESDHRLAVALGVRTSAVRKVNLDIRDGAALEETIRQNAIGRIIHLAALQVPTCATDPAFGASVNVAGFASVFQAVAALGLSAPVVYASSIAVFASDASVVGADGRSTPGLPATFYGVYKRANEGMAAVFHESSGVSSIGLRPAVIYGPGRDVGVTSQATLAIESAVNGRAYEIGFTGSVNLLYVRDAAQSFVAASLMKGTGADVANLPGHDVQMSAFVEVIHDVVPAAKGLISVGGSGLPFPSDIHDTAAELFPRDRQKSIFEGVSETVAAFSAG